jgi:anaerobic magnesium-protoporphyrin IX monomethyl ester cyclase
MRLAEIARTVCPSATIVLGGPHVSSFPLESLAHPAVDYVVMGEGEHRLYSLIESLGQGETPLVSGVLGSPEDKALLQPIKKAPISYIEPVDDLPLPAYDLVDVERYFSLQAGRFSPRRREGGKRAVTIMTSRGCPHQCVFCSIHSTMGYKWRPHSPAYVKKHIEYLISHHAIDFIHFEDDNLTHSPTRYDEILDVLLSLNPKVPWDTPNGVRGDSWSVERVRRTKAAGCQFLTVGVESGVQRVLDKVIKKRLDLSEVDRLIRFCEKESLRLGAFYVIGLPGETLEEIESTVAFALDRYRRFGVLPMLNIAMPLPGTALHDQVVNQALHSGPLRYGFNEIVTDQFDPEILNAIYRRYSRCKVEVFLRRSLSHWGEFTHNLRLLWIHRKDVVLHLKRAVVGISS